MYKFQFTKLHNVIWGIYSIFLVCIIMLYVCSYFFSQSGLKSRIFIFSFFSLPLQILKFISYTNGEFVPIKISFTKNNEYTCISTTWNFFKKPLIFKSFLLDIFRIYGTISSESNSERIFDTYEN